MKIIFLAYANSPSNLLPDLHREDEGVFSSLVNRGLKGDYFIHRQSFATLENLNQGLKQYGDQLALFLFSGHADNQNLQLFGDNANGAGIALQLEKSARSGNLKLVVLNGCATADQVSCLQEVGIPAVIATYAKVHDKSATEFSLRFFNNLAEHRLSIQAAFTDALGPAQTATQQDLSSAQQFRGIVRQEPNPVVGPLWGLFTSTPEVLGSNPLPHRSSTGINPNFVPNEKLTATLFSTFAQHPDIKALEEQEARQGYLEIGQKQAALVNILPFPVAIHLQKLLCPVDEPDEGSDEGFDKTSMKRLRQMGVLYHHTLEFLAFVTISQLWEFQLKGRIEKLPPELLAELRRYFYLPLAERAVFDYLAFIRQLQAHFETLKLLQDPAFFVPELAQLQSISEPGSPFFIACQSLYNLRKQISQPNSFVEADVPDLCEQGELHLCTFFAELAFLHQYILASVQNIDIQKYRHQLKPNYNHTVLRLMRAIGKPEQLFYLLSEILDNRGVMLLKGRVDYNPTKKQFVGAGLQFLNLSPFAIDLNAFEKNANLSNLLFFEQVNSSNNTYQFKSTKRPDNPKDKHHIEALNGFEVVTSQWDAFRTSLLLENLQSA